jgi:uracil-DNA glycosylase
MTKAQKQKALDKIAAEIRKSESGKKDRIGVAVPGEGNPDADLMFVGEAPGKQEAETGRPFIGRAGKVLRGTLAEIGIPPEDVFITSAVKYLPTYVTPTLADIEQDKPFLMKQIAVIQPKVIVLLGKTACLAVLGKAGAMTKDRGTIIEKDGLSYFISLHPAAVLYSSKLLPNFKEDFKTLKKLVSKLG